MTDEVAEEVDLAGFPAHLMGSRSWTLDQWVAAVQPAPGWILIQAPPKSKLIVTPGSEKGSTETLAVVRKVGKPAYNHRTSGTQPMDYLVGDIVLVNGDAITQYPEWREHRIGITYYEHLLGRVDEVALAQLEPKLEEAVETAEPDSKILQPT